MPPTMFRGSKRNSQESSLRARPEPSCSRPARRGSRSPPPWLTGTPGPGARRVHELLDRPRGRGEHREAAVAELGVAQVVRAQQIRLGQAEARVGDLGEAQRVEAVVGRGVLERRHTRDLLELVVERGALEGGRGLRRDRRDERGGRSGEGEGGDELHFAFMRQLCC